MTDEHTLSRSWRGLDVTSTERLRLVAGDALSIESRVVRGDAALLYSVELATDWTFRWLRVERADGLGFELARGVDGWTVEGAPRVDLAGAIDIDLAFSPFTNTIPIRRLGLDIGGSAEIVTAYVDDELEVVAEAQRYTRLTQDVYRYEALDGSFDREIAVDPEGFVVEYPGLFVAIDLAAE